MYKENPKTQGSGIYTCIPQKGRCPNNCPDCFFQNGRSYLEPLDENLPNIPPDEIIKTRIIRVNDGNDSNFERDKVVDCTRDFPHKFYNTAIHKDLGCFPGPVVLTINPGNMTDTNFNSADIGLVDKLMFVRFRVNAWNLDICDKAVDYYSNREIPIVLTFMAYYNETIKSEYEKYYTYRKRTLNSYWAITTAAWEMIMSRYKYNKWVYSCGKIEGELGITSCRFCGNCIREYWAALERMNSFKKEDL